MNPILVRKINHLTDARYFAAMGVDWISMELGSDPASFMRWHTLKDWVAGVKLAAEIDMNDEMVLAKTIIDARPDGIFVEKDSSGDLLSELEIFYQVNSTDEIIPGNEAKLILPYSDMTPVESLLNIPSDKIFLEAIWTVDMLTDLRMNGYVGGICFMGGDEDITGVRDYGVIDEMMEILGH
ncbi:MAG TPA: hypothetical protein VFG10_09140 [Saprospiraceae bacterium]|nr:hypothetical protein [Saprospiraceae bacterium]